TNLPMTFADNAPNSATLLGQLLDDHLDVATYNIKTFKYWTNSSRTHAYAFLETATERMGQYLIDNVHHVTIDGCVLRAEWTTDSKPNIVMNSIRLTTTNHPSLWLYYHADHGLVQVWDYVHQVEIPSHEWGPLRLPRHHPHDNV
ncbi:MAG: hypothetical protein ACKPKO_32400, partial [Candidatus Fonsibacter sp.]